MNLLRKQLSNFSKRRFYPMAQPEFIDTFLYIQQSGLQPSKADKIGRAGLYEF
ncbi:MAG: hypothetical protein H0W58_04515 [Acidobacteria bacterium]|jgi:hypothetical protein|nr:hypothetical protein [Acidobacteriota bacterium]